MKNIWDNEPDFINELGTKWWKQNEMTAIAHRPNKKGVSLPNIQAWVIETVDGSKTYVLLNTDIGEIIYDSQQYEAICTYIEIQKFLKSCD